MSALFFDELGIDEPRHNLGIGSGTHAEQTGRMLMGIEEVLQAETPQGLLVYGDTNSTLAGALAATKLHIPVMHVEAGLRSYNRAMPEEINRVAVDHISEVLLCPSLKAVNILRDEGLTAGVHFVGDVMYDAVLHALAVSEGGPTAMDRLGLQPKGYYLATVHRPQNTDNVECLKSILGALDELRHEVIFPVHPRTRKVIDSSRDPLLGRRGNVRLIEPVGYLDMVQLLQNARILFTDSGGMQKEAFFVGVPCITMRNETEWIETVEAGWNTLVGSNAEMIRTKAGEFEEVRWAERGKSRPEPYGDGHGARRILDVVRATVLS